MFDIFDVALEIYIEDKLVNKQSFQAPKEMIIINFIQMAKQIKNDNRPVRIKMIRPEIIWDEFEKRQIVFNNEIELSNDAMTAWQESKR